VENSRDLAESVVALLVVLGSKSAEQLATKRLLTPGLKACRPVAASPSQPRRRQRRRPRAAHALNVARSRNPAKKVVVVPEVLGSETAEVVATQKKVTRGLRACRLAKHARW